MTDQLVCCVPESDVVRVPYYKEVKHYKLEYWDNEKCTYDGFVFYGEDGKKLNPMLVAKHRYEIGNFKRRKAIITKDRGRRLMEVKLSALNLKRKQGIYDRAQFEHRKNEILNYYCYRVCDRCQASNAWLTPACARCGQSWYEMKEDFREDGNVMDTFHGNDKIVVMDKFDARKLPPRQTREGINVLITGRDKQTDVDCGKPFAVYRAGSGKVIVKHNSCRHQGCPKCFKEWARARADKVSAYMMAQMRHHPNITEQKLYHYVWSPDPNCIDESDPYKLKEFKYFLKNFNGSGMSVIRAQHLSGTMACAYVKHPYRLKCADCGGNVAGEFGKREICESCGSLKSVWVYSPHLHFVSNLQYRYKDNNILKLYFETKRVTVMNLSYNRYKAARRRNESVSDCISDRKALQNVIEYELSHAEYIPGSLSKSVNYLGNFSRSQSFKELTEKRVRKVHVDEDGNHYFKLCGHFKPIIMGWEFVHGGHKYYNGELKNYMIVSNKVLYDVETIFERDKFGEHACPS